MAAPISVVGGGEGGCATRDASRLLSLEAMLIQKISMRSSSLPKALGKVLKQFDADGSGELSYDELSRALKCFLPGIDEGDLLALARSYDADGNGTISATELTQRATMLEARSKGSDPLPLPASTRFARHAASRSVRSESVTSKALPPRSERLTFDERVNQYTSSLRRRLGASKAGERRSASSLSYHSSEMARRKGREILKRALLRESEAERLNQAEFRAALRSLREPGCPDLSDSDVSLLWESCNGGHSDTFIQLVYGDKKGVADAAASASAKAIEDGHPKRYRYRRCKTHVSAPSNLDVDAALERSTRLPNLHLTLDHIHGFGSGCELGPNLFCSGKVLFYSIAGVIVALDVSTGRQSHMLSHTDDVSSMCLSGDGCWGASGQVGRRPSVLIWSTESVGCSKWERVLEIGKGFFDRAIAAVSLNRDGTMLAAVGCDDRHMMGVWNLKLDPPQLIGQSPCQNGIPRQICELSWAPGLVTFHAKDGKKKATLSEMLVSVGKSKHVKLWTVDANRGTLEGQTVTFGTGANNTPKTVVCVAWLSQSMGSFLIGGDNGFIYAFSDGECSGYVEAHPGHSVNRIRVKSTARDDYCSGGGDVEVFSSGSDGKIKKWCVKGDGSSFTVLEHIDVPSWGADIPLESSLFPKKPKQRPLRPGMKAAVLKSGNNGSSTRGVPKRFDFAMEVDHKTNAQTFFIGTSDGNIICQRHQSLSKASDARRLLTGHSKSVAGLATDPIMPSRYATAGEDGYVIIWEAKSSEMGHQEVCRARLDAPGKSVAFSPDGRLIAVGMKRGAVSIFQVDEEGQLSRVLAFRDCDEDLDDIKFSPNGLGLAVGSHDNYVDLYDIAPGGYGAHKRGEQLAMRHRARCKGHSSYVTHLDWSMDSSLLQSNCGAYEILYWDAKSGKQLRSTRDSVESDALWNDWTCVLGFPVMGIWEMGGDGTDVNSVHRSSDGRFVATADDRGKIKLFNYPCIAKDSPSRSYSGHSSHVANVRFSAGDKWLVSCGGLDKGVFCWRVHRRPPSSHRGEQRQGDYSLLQGLPSRKKGLKPEGAWIA